MVSEASFRQMWLWLHHPFKRTYYIYLPLKWLRYFPPVGAEGEGVVGPVDSDSENLFPSDILDKSCTIERVRQIMHVCEKRLSWKECIISKWRPFYWFSFRMIAQYHENWLNHQFPEDNDICLKEANPH